MSVMISMLLMVVLSEASPIMYTMRTGRGGLLPAVYQTYEMNKCYISAEQSVKISTEFSYERDAEITFRYVYSNKECSGNPIKAEEIDTVDSTKAERYSKLKAPGHVAFINYGSCVNESDHIHTYFSSNQYKYEGDYYKALVEKEDGVKYFRIMKCKDENCDEDDMNITQEYKCHECNDGNYVECGVASVFITLALVLAILI